MSTCGQPFSPNLPKQVQLLKPIYSKISSLSQYTTRFALLFTNPKKENNQSIMSRNRKRDKPYFSRQVPVSLSKRRRPHPPRHDGGDDDGGDVIEDKPIQKPAPPPALVVTGLPTECSVLDLKSRFEIYGSISRIRIVDRDGLAYVMYRAKDSAEAAIAASLDPSFGITIDSKKVLSL